MSGSPPGSAAPPVTGRAALLSALLSVQRALLDAPPVHVLDVLAAEVKDLVGADSVVVSIDSESGLRVAATAGQHCRGAFSGDLVVPESTLAGLTLRTGAAQASNDLGDDARVQGFACTVHAHASCITAPLVDDVVIGVVSAFTERPSAFSSDQLQLLQLCANAVGGQLKGNPTVLESLELRERLHLTSSRLRAVGRIPGLAWWEMDLVTGTPRWSDELYGLFGLERTDRAPTVEDFLRVVHPDDRALMAELASGRLAAAPGPGHLVRIVRPDGEERLLQAWASTQRDQSGRPLRMIGVALDVTEREQNLQRLSASEELFRAAFEHAPTGVVLVTMEPGREGEVLRANDSICELLGTTQDQVVGRHAGQWLHPEDRRVSFLDPVSMLEGLQRPRVVERRVVRADGGLRHLQFTSSLLQGEGPGSPYVLAHVVDVTDTRAQRAELERLALTDTLTGLDNRTMIERRVTESLARLRAARRRDDGVVLLLLDLDRFKLVNDSLGHGAGDALLTLVAARLRSVVRDPATVGRLGGDEFVVLLGGIPDVDVAMSVAARIREAFRQPVVLPSGQELVCTVSIGVTLARGGDPSPEDMLRQADLALYKAKEEGRDRFAVFDAELEGVAVARMDTENRLRAALQTHGLRVHLQPILPLTGEPALPLGHEALLRVADPELGELAPLPFVEVAEETGLITEVDTWVLGRVVALLGDDVTSLAVGPRVAVNVSGRTLEQPGFARRLGAMLDEHGVSGHRLSLEITERVLLEGTDGVERTVQAVRALGVRVGLDDFGTGYSALNHLQRFELDFLKVDQSFVSALGTSHEQGAKAAAMVKAVVDLAHSLGLSVVAEGVETRQQALALRDVGCDQGQGWLFGRDFPAPVLASTPG